MRPWALLKQFYQSLLLLEMSELPVGPVRLVLRAQPAEEQNSSLGRAVLRAGTADPWGMFPPGARHNRSQTIQSCRTVPVQCQSQCGYFCTVLHCALRAIREFGVGIGHLWNPIPHGFRERNADCPAAVTPSSHFHCAVNT